MARARTQLRYGATIILLSLVGLTQFQAFSRWYHGGPVPTPGAFWSLSCLVLFPLGLVLISNAIRGLPRLTIGPQGISLQLAFKTKWANWDSVAPFVVRRSKPAAPGGKSKRRHQELPGRMPARSARSLSSSPTTTTCRSRRSPPTSMRLGRRPLAFLTWTTARRPWQNRHRWACRAFPCRG